MIDQFFCKVADSFFIAILFFRGCRPQQDFDNKHKKYCLSILDALLKSPHQPQNLKRLRSQVRFNIGYYELREQYGQETFDSIVFGGMI